MSTQSKVFDMKYAFNGKNKFDGEKDGEHWKGKTKNYMCGLIPAVKPLLEWAESFGKTPISQVDVERLRHPNIEEDPVIISHLMCNYFKANLIGAAKEIYDNVEMYQGFEVWRRISLKINVWGERRRDELAEIVNNPKSTGKVEDMAKVLEAWDTSHRYYVAVGGRPLQEDDRLRILKKIVPQIILNELIARDFHDWPTAKEWVLEMSRRIAMHGRSGKPLHLAEAEGIDPLASLADDATTDEILAVINSKWSRVKNTQRTIGAAGTGRPPPRAAGAAGATAGAGRPSLTTKDGHTKDTCKQPKLSSAKESASHV